MSTGYRISRWMDLYEPSRHEVRHGRELRYVKAYVHGGDQSTSCRNLIYLAKNANGDRPANAGVTARDAFAMFVKLLEMAGDTPRGWRDGTIYARSAGQAGERRPASLESVARALWPMWDDVDQVRACIDLLCHPDVAWVEPFEWDEASFAEELASRLRQMSEKWRQPDAAVTPQPPASGINGASAGRDRGVLTEPVTEPNRTGNGTELNTGTGAMGMRDDRAGPGRSGSSQDLDTSKLAAALGRFSGNGEAWAIKACELLCEYCGLPAATRSAQRGAVTSVMLRVAERVDRAELGARLIVLARSKLGCKVLRNPWGAWQVAADKEVSRLGRVVGVS